MNFGFSEEQEMLRDQVRRFMQEDLPMTRVRALGKTPDGFDRALWNKAASLGWLGLTIPEKFGGLGLNWVDLTVLLEEAGRGLSPLPFVSHALTVEAILAVCGKAQKTMWLPSMAAGEVVCTLALYDEPNWIHPDAITLRGTSEAGGVRINGTKHFVNDALAADYFMIAIRIHRQLALVAVGKDQVTVKPQPQMDTTKPSGSVTFDNLLIDNSMVFRLSRKQLDRLTDCGAVAVTAEAVGAAEAVHRLTVDYANQRVQFDNLIGRYQGVKHRLADMYVDIESFKSLLYYAAWAVDHGPAELPRAISLAKGYAADAFAQIGIDCIGLHGAIGFTAEYDAQLYLKRSKWARPAFGDSDFHLQRVATLGGV
jgi:alkylation response protein AidB-like acyl-CoA dehydrogenase